MGKIKKLKGSKVDRHNPLEKQILDVTYAKASTRQKIRNRQEEEEFVGDKLSKKILKQAQKQQEDLEEEVGLSRGTRKVPSLQDAFEGANALSDEDDAVSVSSHCPDIVHISEEDSKALEAFMSSDPSKRATLADIIKEKLTEKRTEVLTEFSDTGSVQYDKNFEEIKPLYRDVGKFLSTYRSGKIPKPFKVLPLLSYWEEVLYVTEPDKWSSAAMYQATRIFASNLKEKMAQRFYNLILLPRLRDDIADSHQLNFHLYQALKKALFKPGAFFKGIILPLCEAGDCTLREATIFGSVLAKCSIPILHSSAAVVKIAEMDYNGANSIFLRILLEKKYSLPFRAVDAVVSHFLRFMSDERTFPLLWHQCLLTFAQLYKNDVTLDQRDALLKLINIHSHEHVTPEIRKELLSSVCRARDKTVEMKDVNTN